MQDEEMDYMDELIRKASESHHPVYEDKAWEKMEALLDEHLPLKDNRRRPAVFFMLLLILSVTAYFAILYHPLPKKENIPGENKLAAIPPPVKPANIQQGGPHIASTSSNTGREMSATILQGGSERSQGGNVRKVLSGNHLTFKRGNSKTNISGSIGSLTREKELGLKKGKDLQVRDDDQVVLTDNNYSLPPTPANRLLVKPVVTGIQTIKNDSAAMAVIKDTTKAAVPGPVSNKNPVKSAIKKGFTNNIAINLSAGPDLSFVSFGDGGKTRLVYGAGLSYTFNNRFTVRSGFYKAKKTYSAKSSDYHPPSGYWTYNANLQSIAADCDVYEIPLSVSYNFAPSKNHNWFAGIGFSTFLMKRETYNYLYKDAWGQSRNKAWTLLNGSNHYFSVMTISGGYQYKVNPWFSILAEPYFKLPLHGIGFGKIKLNSGGLLFTASIRPFAKRK